MLRPGDVAPEIDAIASDGSRFRLSEQRGKLCTIVYFFPKAFTPGCTIETKRFRDNYPEMLLAGAAIVGVSTDSHDTQCLFARSLRTPFPMIGDNDKAISKAYDVLWPLVGRSMRVTFIVNPLRTIEAVLHHEINISQHRDDVLRVMDRMLRTKARPGKLDVKAASVPSSTRDAPLEPYELLAEAGSGGMGTVYRARERATGRIVAVKLLTGQGDAARFAVEIELLSKLVHPNIVAYVAHGTADDGRTYLVMEWLEGQSLASRLLADGKMSVHESVGIARDIAAGLAAAHANGVIHRDIKPSNVLITTNGAGAPGAVKLLDFGVARPTEKGSNALTQTGQLVGTPGYMSPEQVRGVRDLDARTDLFALGCVLFRCIAGRGPFSRDDALKTLYAIANEPPPRLESAPPALDALVTELLAKEPTQRPESAEVVRARLDVIWQTLTATPAVIPTR